MYSTNTNNFLSLLGDRTGTENSSIKYVIPIISHFIHPICNKGLTNKIKQLAEFHQNIFPPLESPQPSQSIDFDSDSKDTEHMDMEILDIEEENQGQLDDSSPKIPTRGEERQNDKDELMSNIIVEP